MEVRRRQGGRGEAGQGGMPGVQRCARGAAALASAALLPPATPLHSLAPRLDQHLDGAIQEGRAVGPLPGDLRFAAGRVGRRRAEMRDAARLCRAAHRPAEGKAALRRAAAHRHGGVGRRAGPRELGKRGHREGDVGAGAVACVRSEGRREHGGRGRVGRQAPGRQRQTAAMAGPAAAATSCVLRSPHRSTT